MHGLRVIDGGGHYSFDLVGFYDLFLPSLFNLEEEKKLILCKEKKFFTCWKLFVREKNSFLTHFSPPPPRKERLVISHSYHIISASLSLPNISYPNK